MHAKSDSWATSMTPSSPDHSRRPVYFVQSPSHDGEKAQTSFRSTPVLTSPIGSPVHSSVGRHSRDSSNSRFSGWLRPGWRRFSTNDVGSGGRGGKKNLKGWDAIEEERLLDDEESEEGVSRGCYFLTFVVGFLLLFSLFALILWGVSKHQKPKITMESIKFDRFTVQAGSDDTGVSTEMITINSTLKFNYKNTATFFGLHVSSTPVDLIYSQLRIGSGDIEKFYTKRNSNKNVTVVVSGDQIPMYGSGASFSTATGTENSPVQLKLDLTVRTRAYVLGELVKTRFNKKIECSIAVDIKKLNVPISLNNCTYHE